MKRVDVSLTKQFEKEYNKLLKDYFNALAKATKEIDFSDGILTKKFKNSLKKHSKMYGRAVENLYKTTFQKADDAIKNAFMEELYKTLPEKFRYHGKKYKIIRMEDIQLFEFISDQWVKSSINNYAATAWIWSKPAIDGINLSNRIWKQASKSAEDIKKTLLLNLQKGMSAEKMASQLLKTQDMVKPGLPNYLKADIALLSPGAAEDAIRKYTQQKMRFNAFRTARTEIQRAWRGSYVKMAKQLEFVKGLKWNLSASHPKYDICDDLASEDLGLGPGVYQKDAVPFDGGPAHPQCMCYLTTVLDSVEEWLGEDVPKAVVKETSSQSGSRKGKKSAFNMLPGKNKELENQLNAYEDKIRNRKTEKAVIFDKDGNVIIDKSGSKRKVSFSQYEIESLKEKGEILTHNHPGSSSFSLEDFKMCNELKARNMRITSKYFDYEIKISEKLSLDKTEEVLAEFEENKNKWKNKIANKFSQKHQELSNPKDQEILLYRFNQILSHLAWKDTSKKFKELSYKRWIR